MTLKETDNYSAQGIFESLMLDPDLEIGEGQTREEAAKHEAEFRSRQHFNNMRALSLGTEKSPVKSLLDFISRPSSIWSAAVDLMKASFKDVKSGSYYQQKKKVHPHSELAVSLSEEGQKFVDFLQQNNMPAATINYVTSLAKTWREDPDFAADEDGWIKYVSTNIGTHSELATQLSSANNGGFGDKAQQELSKTLQENGYHAHAPAPKAKTVNQKWFDGERYGSNTKDDLEQTATLDNVNAALQKMGRKEKMHFGQSSKLKFDEEFGNVQQWKAYKEAPENDKRKYTRIVKGQIHTESTDPKGEILSSQMEDYSVAEILRGLFHHIDMDGGQHDVTPQEAVQNNAKDEATQEKLEAYDEAEEQIVADKIAEGSLEPITDAELDKIMHQFQVSKAAEEIDKALPFVLAHGAGQMQTSADIEMHSLAQQFGLVNAGDKVVTSEHLAGIHQAIKDGILVTGNIFKGFPKKKNPDGTDSVYPDTSQGPTHYTLVANQKGGLSGVHAYINYKKAKPVVPPKTAQQIATAPTEELGEGKPVTLNEVAEMAEENNEDFPVENSVDEMVNIQQTLSAATGSLFMEMTNTYMNTSYDINFAFKADALTDNGESVGALFNRFWGKGLPAFSSIASSNLAQALQVNPHLIMGLPGLIDNHIFVNYDDLRNAEELSPAIAEHVKNIQGLHALGAILNDPSKVKDLKEAGTLGAVIKSTMEQVHKVISNPDIPALENMHPMYITHSLEKAGHFNFADALGKALGGKAVQAGTLNSLKQLSATLVDPNFPNVMTAKIFGEHLNNQHGIYDDIFDLDKEIEGAYADAPHSETPEHLQDEPPQLHLSGPAYTEMKAHINNYMDSTSDSKGTDDQFAAIEGLKEILQPELDSMASQSLGLKEKQQIFHNLHTALDLSLVEDGHIKDDFTGIAGEVRNKLNGLHNILNNQFNDNMGNPMASGDWDAIKGYHAAKSLLDSKLAGKPINSMGALYLDDSALNALSNLGGGMIAYEDSWDETTGDQPIDHSVLAHNIQMFMGDLLDDYSPEQKKKLSTETSMLSEHLEHSAYNPIGRVEDTPVYKYMHEHHGDFASQIKDDHVQNISQLADDAAGIGESAAKYPQEQGVKQHHQNALDAMNKGIKEAVDSGAMTQEQAQQLATDAGVDKKHFIGSGAVAKEVNMEPEDIEDAHISIEDATHNLNIAVKEGNESNINEASNVLADLEDSVSVHGIDGNSFKDLLEQNLTSDAYDFHVEGTEPPQIHPEGLVTDDDGEETPWEQTAQPVAPYDPDEEEEAEVEDEEEDVHATVQDVKDAAQEFNEAVQIGDPDDVGQANQKLKKVKEVALAHPNSNVTSSQLDSLVSDELDDKAASEHFGGKPPAKPEGEEPSKVEEELDKVPDAANVVEKQKQDIMQEIFNEDFKDSDDAKAYKAYLDKQKPEKIDSLHEQHVIGNMVKKHIQYKANKKKEAAQGQKAEQQDAKKEEAAQAKVEEKQQKEDDKTKQKEANTVPHKAGEIEKKIEEGQNPKQMARENMVHQHQHGDIMSPKTNKEYADAFHKFEAVGVDMDELLDEKDKHGDNYGSEEHLQEVMTDDAKQEDVEKNYKNHIESDDPEHLKNREKAFKSGQPGKFTTFDKKGNPNKDLHHSQDKYGISSLDEHEHGEGPEADKFDTQTGEELGTHTLHGEPTEDAKKYKEAEQQHKDARAEYNDLYKEAKNLHEDLEEQKKKLDEVDDDSPDAEGEKSEINDKISQIEKDKETNLNARVEADGKRYKAQKALEELPKPKELSEDDVPKTGPPDPEVARRKMAEGYIWHEETRAWIMRENMKNIQGMHGAKDATMIHGGSSHGIKLGQTPKPFALNEDGSTSDNHFVVSQAGVHMVGTPSAKPPGASSHQQTTGASLGHALKDTKVGNNGAVHMPGALETNGVLGKSGLATADNHITQQPEPKGLKGAAMDDWNKLKGGAMDKLKELWTSGGGGGPSVQSPGTIDFKKQEEESALDKFLVKYK